ncbi:GumK N-terminal domain-containing glycosyltransferase [Acetobacter sp.]|jgi:2-beta-glucuronyltransferase|uniref:GumK N-terminal domain-containing glycosyltransferase n=1 Tax=Acetobacter sp. TaxID=440 RepID=UPI0025C00069|nr:glycosyltransferase [Acetobacter sp.]MCH4089799.1 glycosyltransferase [Acetobacter sp.]MCI1298495.1 glycosyltransferase [Acetobacter sp.]MCI1315060.1 glycosyltransferase [Acetobacter sp.]
MTNFLVLSVHDFRSRRKASVHFIATELAKRGQVRFYSTGLSRLSEHRGDTRTDLASRANRVEVENGVECYLQRGLWHPFRIMKTGARPLETAMFCFYRWRMPSILKQWIQQADVVFIESGMATVYISDVKRLNPEARIIYLASDDLAVVGAAQTIQKEFVRHFDKIDLVRLPSRLLLDGMPHSRNAIFAPQGVDRELMERTRPTPFKGRLACVSVGSMLFDASFFNLAAPEFPDLDFHVIGAGRAAELLDRRPNIIVHDEMPFEETLDYVQNCAFGIAPYKNANTPRYLFDTSLKLKQFAFFGKPAVCPEFTAGEDRSRFGYVPGNRTSILTAIRGALTCTDPITLDIPTWADVVDRLLTPERFPEHRIVNTTNNQTVAIYRTEILPLSETFVRDQALWLHRWKPVLIGEREVDKLPLEGLRVQSVYKGAATFLQKACGAIARRLDLPPPGIMRIARRVNPSLIHAHFGFDGVEAWPIARRLGVPLVVTLHGSDIHTNMDWFASGSGGRRWKDYPRRLARLAKYPQVSFIAVSGPIRESAIRNGIPANRISICHIGVNIERFQPSAPPIGERGPVILFVGRLVEKKAPSILLEAFRHVRHAVPDAQLIIAGDGPQRDALEQQASSIGAVSFKGAVTLETIRSLMKTTRAFCLPSITASNGDAEGLGLVLLEAQASGVPVVTSANGGATEGMIDAETGFAFQEKDTEALTRHLITLLTDDALATRFGKNARVYIEENHDIRTCTARLEAAYDWACAQ